MCAVTSQRTTSPSFCSRASTPPAALTWPPAQVRPVALIATASPVASAVMVLASSAYVFSRVNTRNPKRNPANSTDGSGKSKLNFMNARPRGGINTSLVEVSGRMGGGGGGGGPAWKAGVAGSIAPAPAALIVFSHTRRVIGSIGWPFLTGSRRGVISLRHDRTQLAHHRAVFRAPARRRLVGRATKP